MDNDVSLRQQRTSQGDDPIVSTLVGAGHGETRPADGGRDRFIDLVRVGALATVVFLHWLSVMPTIIDGRFTDQNVVAVVPHLWPLTWLGDVMALFFFAGGYANWVSMRDVSDRGEPVRAYVAKRFRRLMVPALGFVGAWLGLDLAMSLVGLARWSPLRHVSLGNTSPFGPLWFLGVYLLIVALSPATAAAHRRWGVAVPLAMAIGVLAADSSAAVLDTGAPLLVNLLLVWSIPHQLGYFYADGRLRRLSSRALLGTALTGLLGLVALTSLPLYPRSLLGPRWQVLTMDAPMMPLVTQGVCFVSVALLCRPLVERALADPRRWAVVNRANRLGMAVYLWHMTAYLMAVVLLAALGVRSATMGSPSAEWWLGRPVVMAVSCALLVGTLTLSAAVRRLTRLSLMPLRSHSTQRPADLGTSAPAEQGWRRDDRDSTRNRRQ